ncbi:MAG TPA: acyltransferase [Steroidobacteraceae bacterium]|nr:acyltransferase [Steroidobacteraceae bacterium]
MTQHHRDRSLDLLRAMAIVLVVTAHSVLAYGAPPGLAPLQLGGTGVDLFFVLSGWLLGGQLVRELDQTGTVNLQRFWVRRWMRTLPAYYTVLAFTLLQQRIGHPDHPFRPDYLVFLQNYLGPEPFFAVSWSLCVEEHFYLFIAPALLLLVRIGVWRWLPILILFAMPYVCRHLGLYGSMEQTHVHCDGCMLGVALAACRYNAPRVWRALTRYVPVLAVLATLAYLANYVGRWVPELGWHDYSPGIYALVFGTWVVLACRSDWWRQNLYVPGARYVALRSYSIYLLHPEILALLKRFAPHIPFPLFYVSAWIGSCLLAEGLYRLVEKPIMDARERLSVATADASAR